MDKISQLLTRRVDKIYPSKKALEKVLRSGKKLRLYQGFDPSTPNLHIGHLVGLLKLKEFQNLGHEVIFLIGDFTGMIGDPTGKIEGARPQLSHQQVLKNAKTYKKQAGMILNFSGKNPVKIRYNGEWLSKLSAIKAFQLMRFLTIPQIIKRDMFQKRIKSGKDLFASEIMYPFMQAYDSLYMNVDLEIGGSDQMFNMLVGRDLMKKVKRKEKFVMTTKLLVDSQGNKIGKTEGNAINIANPPEVLFAQIMNLSDDCILPCFELITEVPMNRVREVKKAIKTGENPMKYKKELAGEIVEMLYNKQVRAFALSHFEKVVQKKQLPQKMPTFPLKNLTKNPINVIDLLMETKLASSKSEAKRLIRQGGVEINKKKILKYKNIKVLNGDILKVGKRRWMKIRARD